MVRRSPSGSYSRSPSHRLPLGIAQEPSQWTFEFRSCTVDMALGVENGNIRAPFRAAPEPSPPAIAAVQKCSKFPTEPSCLMHRTSREEPVKISHAYGSRIYCDDGREILDGCGGAGSASVGYGNKEIIGATSHQSSQVPYVHTGQYTTAAPEHLAITILKIPPGGFQHGLKEACFYQGGSESNEAALRIGRQFFVEKGESQRVNYVYRLQSYAGTTIGTAAISSHVARKAPFLPILPANTSFAPPAFEYHYKSANESQDEYVNRIVAETEAEFLRVGPQTIISFTAETVVGATSGAVSAPPGYFKAIRELCNKYDILLHLDEVMCGMGRTGTYFAFEQEDIQPDIVTIGKGLGAGYSPLSGMLISGKISEVIKNSESGGFNHGSTFQNHASGCAGALQVQEIIHRDKLIERVAKLGPILLESLEVAFRDCEYVGDIRGRGFLIAVEFVADRETKESLDPKLKFAVRIKDTALKRGLAVYPGSGTVDGFNGDHVLLAPAFNMAEEDLKLMVELLKAVYVEEAAKL